MRKLALALLLLIAFTLAACGESSVAATPTDTTAIAPPPATATTAPPAATATTAPPAATATTGGGGGAAATITMGQFSFTGDSATIKAGQSVTFDDPANGGGIHDIVTGSNGQFSAASGAPSAFASASGVNFSPGVSQTVVFATAGTYTFTCTIHPSMHATVTVTA